MIKVFIAEDDQFLGNILKAALEKIENVEATLFLAPEDVIQKLYLNPDIVTIDYLMPGMNGIELLEKIKNYDENIQCIMVSGQEELNVVIDTYKKGANDYVIKNEGAVINVENAVRN